MVAKVTKPFVDVMGISHKKGDTLSLSELGAKRYIAFIEMEVKKSGKRKSSSSPKAKSTDDE